MDHALYFFHCCTFKLLVLKCNWNWIRSENVTPEKSSSCLIVLTYVTSERPVRPSIPMLSNELIKTTLKVFCTGHFFPHLHYLGNDYNQWVIRVKTINLSLQVHCNVSFEAIRLHPLQHIFLIVQESVWLYCNYFTKAKGFFTGSIQPL